MTETTLLQELDRVRRDKQDGRCMAPTPLPEPSLLQFYDSLHPRKTFILGPLDVARISAATEAAHTKGHEINV